MRVLVVSEDAKERMRATSALTLHEGAEVTEATSAKEARAILREGATFDVLVVDGDLTPQGGFSFLYEARADADLRGVPTPPSLVMIAREQDRFLSDWAGANELLLKPVDSFELAKRTSALVGETPASSRPGPQTRPGDVSGTEIEETLADEHGTAGLSPQA